MPRVWSWNQRVAARWSLAYWKVAVPGSHVDPDASANFVLELVVEACPRVAKPAGMLLALRQVPRLGVAVALLGGVPAVQVGRRSAPGPVYGPGRRGERRRGCRGRRAARRVGPVQRGVDRQQVRQEAGRWLSTSSLTQVTRTGPVDPAPRW